MLPRAKAPHRDGVAVAVIHDGKVLALKRSFIPLLMEFPGRWSLLMGARERGERHSETALREIWEEARISRGRILSLMDLGKVTLRSKGLLVERRWSNKLFAAYSATAEISLNFENKDFEWLTVEELRRRGALDAFDRNVYAAIRRAARGNEGRTRA